MTPPAWLLEAREHLRANYPADGLAESVLWALAAAGFNIPDDAPKTDEDTAAA